jgi:hypothetical protein
MTTQAILTLISSTVPVDKAPANIIVSLSGPSPTSQTVPVDTPSITFSKLLPGDYTYSVQTVDASNAPITNGATTYGPITGTFTLVAALTGSVVTSVTVALS